MQTILKALSWTFIHSLWQGLLLSVVAAIILALTRKSRPSSRYNALGVLMIFFIISTGITFQGEYRSAFVSTETSNTLAMAASNVSPVAELVPVTISGAWITWFDNHYQWFMIVWLLLFMFQVARLWRGVYTVKQLRTSKHIPVTHEWTLRFQRLCHSINLHQRVSLVQSAAINVPIAIGILKPMILLPIGLINHLTPIEVETILLHELAHIRRRDYLVNFIQHIVESIFFFNPAVLWVSSLLRDEREASCDAMVLKQSGDSSNYLNALVAFQEYALPSSKYVMAAGHNKGSLLNRVRRIVTNENQPLNRMEKLCLLAGVILFSAFTCIKYAPVEKLLSMKEVFPDARMTIEKKAVVEKLPVANARKKQRRNLIIQPIDTLPKKKKQEMLSADTPVKSSANVALNDIRDIKSNIQVSKDSIETKKAKLKQYENDPEKKAAIQKEIEKDREDINRNRKELNIKRVQFDEYRIKELEKKKANEKDMPIKKAAPSDQKDEKKGFEGAGPLFKKIQAETSDKKEFFARTFAQQVVSEKKVTWNAVQNQNKLLKEVYNPGVKKPGVHVPYKPAPRVLRKISI